VTESSGFNSTITADGARIVDHEDKSKKSNHEEYAPTLPNLTTVAAARIRKGNMEELKKHNRQKRGQVSETEINNMKALRLKN